MTVYFSCHLVKFKGFGETSCM